MQDWDPGGGVFLPIEGATYPVFAFGHGKIKDPVFTCPVSAIPEPVWDLIDLFLTCRSMKLPPVAGGVLDQPYIVRRAWPVLEAEMAPIDRERDQAGQLTMIATLLSSIPLVRMPGKKR